MQQKLPGNHTNEAAESFDTESLRTPVDTPSIGWGIKLFAPQISIKCKLQMKLIDLPVCTSQGYFIQLVPTCFWCHSQICFSLILRYPLLLYLSSSTLRLPSANLKSTLWAYRTGLLLRISKMEHGQLPLILSSLLHYFINSLVLDFYYFLLCQLN